MTLGKLLDTPEAERTDTYADDLGKLTTEVRSLETDVGAAMAAGDDKVAEVATSATPEGKEYRELETRSSVDFRPVLFDRRPWAHGQPDGAAMLELQPAPRNCRRQITFRWSLISGYGQARGTRALA